MADYNLGTARGRVEIDASGVGRGLRDANSQLDEFQGKAKSSGTGMIVAGSAMVGAAASIAGGFAVAINAAASFEERLSAIKAVSGATAEEMELISEKALQLGADTKYSASESASAMEELVKAGLSVEDVLNGAADATVNLAAAGEVDLVTAATIASNAMNAFGLSAEEMPKVADLIAGAANASAIDVNEFGMAMSQSAAVADLAGMSFDDLSVAIAAMGNAGIKGSDAGTSLKTFLQNLQPVTEKQIGLFKELGIVTEDGTNRFYDQTGSLKPLSEIAGVLGESLAGMTDAQKQMALETMFGSDAIRAAAVIAETGAEGFDTLAASMGEISAADVAATRMDNLKGSIEQLKGSAETLLIKIGLPLAEALRVWVDRLTAVVNWISALDEDTLAMAATIAKMVSAFLGSVGSILVLYGGLQKLRAGILLLNLAVRANPVGAFITLLVGLGAALYTLYNSNETFREAVDKLFATLKSTVMPIIETIITGFGAMVAAFNGDGITSDGIVGKFEQVGVIARQVFEWIQAFITDDVIPAFQDFAGFITGTVVPAIQDFADFFVNEVIPVVVDVAEKIAWLASEISERLVSAFNWIRDNVFPIIVSLGELFGAIAGRISDGVGIISTVITALGPVWAVLAGMVRGALQTIQTVISTAVSIIQIIWKNFGDNLFAVIDFVWDTITGIVENALRIINGIIQVVTGIISGDWGKAWEGIRNIFGGVWDFIASLPGTVLGLIQLSIRNFIDLIITVWQGGWEMVKGVLQIAWEGIKNVIRTAADAVIAFMRNLPGQLVGALGALGGLLVSKGGELINGLWQGAISVKDSLLGWIRSIPNQILSALGDMGRLLYNIGKEIIGGLLDGIKNAFNGVKDFVGGIGNTIKSLKGPLSYDKVMLKEEGIAIMQGLQRAMESQMPSLRKMVSEIGPSISATVSTTGSSALSASQMAVGSDGASIDVTLNFPGVTSASEAEAIKTTLKDPSMLNELTRTIKAGVR